MQEIGLDGPQGGTFIWKGSRQHIIFLFWTGRPCLLSTLSALAPHFSHLNMYAAHGGTKLNVRTVVTVPSIEIVVAGAPSGGSVDATVVVVTPFEQV